VKGRRRARHAALQALYELDLTDHAVARVLAVRAGEFYRSAAAQALERADRRTVEHLIDRHAADAFAAVPVAGVAAGLGVDGARVAAVADFLQQLAPHVAYFERIVLGIGEHRAAIDAVIHRIAPEWPVDQMAPIDRNVLRIALWEMGTGASPVRVAINEAVELARLFSGEASRRMVNGALGAYVSGGPHLELSEGDSGAPIG